MSLPSYLHISDGVVIPRGELNLTFARSSGPGGQNVNKVNTKAVLRWNVRESESLPEDVRRRLVQQAANRLNEAGELVLSSDRFREQGRNIGACVDKLTALVLKAAHPPARRRPTRPPRRVKEARLKDKRSKATKKQLRGKPSADD